MRKWIVFSSLLSLLLLSSCSWKPEKEIITKAEVYVPTINVVPRPEPLTLKNADVIVITEKNLQEVIKRVKDMQGSFVVYALDPKSFEALAINMEQIKLYIEQQKQIIDFMDFLLAKTKQKEAIESDETYISALEAAGEVVGSVDWGPGDLASNKKYLDGLK